MADERFFASGLSISAVFFFNDTATTEIYTTTDTLSLHDALPISLPRAGRCAPAITNPGSRAGRSEEHTSELQSPVVISYAVFCLNKKKEKRRSAATRMCSLSIEDSRSPAAR